MTSSTTPRKGGLQGIGPRPAPELPNSPSPGAAGPTRLAASPAHGLGPVPRANSSSSNAWTPPKTTTPAVSRPAPDTLGPRRSPNGWTTQSEEILRPPSHGAVPATAASSPTPVGVAYDVAKNYIDEGRDAMRRWMPAIDPLKAATSTLTANPNLADAFSWTSVLQPLLDNLEAPPPRPQRRQGARAERSPSLPALPRRLRDSGALVDEAPVRAPSPQSRGGGDSSARTPAVPTIDPVGSGKNRLAWAPMIKMT